MNGAATRSEHRNRGPVVGVVLTSPYPLARVTGIGRFVQDLVRFLGLEGIKAEVVSPAGVPGPSAPGEVTLRWRVFASLELALATSVKLVRTRSTFQVVHAQQPHLQSLAAILLGRILGKRAVLTVHVRPPVGPGMVRRLAHRLISELCMRTASVRVAVSPFVARTFQSKRPAVIENGVDTVFFSRSAEGRRKIRARLGLRAETAFVYAGRLTSTKGVDFLLDAADSELLDGRLFRLVLLGEVTPDEPDFLQDRLRSIANPTRILFVGSVTHELPAYLSAGDLFVAPSPYEGMPLAFLEAMATGLPPLASDIPVHRMLVERSGVGWLFPSGDAQQLAKLMRNILDHGIPAQWEEQARAMVHRCNDIRAMVAEYVRVYEGLSPQVEAEPAQASTIRSMFT